MHDGAFAPWHFLLMPRKVRELVADLLAAGFTEIAGGGKGSHRKFSHPRFAGAVTVSGRAGDDAKAYQEKQLRRALEEINEKD
jgi:predicted RNA binding protein YcfA (HicA-like mRNA interferase family)